jgi:hypothetical protein
MTVRQDDEEIGVLIKGFKPSVTGGDGETGVPAAGGGDAGFYFEASLRALKPDGEEIKGLTTEGTGEHRGRRGYFRKRRSAERKTRKTTEMTPFMVKKAALSLERSSGLTRVCS